MGGARHFLLLSLVRMIISVLVVESYTVLYSDGILRNGVVAPRAEMDEYCRLLTFDEEGFTCLNAATLMLFDNETFDDFPNQLGIPAEGAIVGPTGIVIAEN